MSELVWSPYYGLIKEIFALLECVQERILVSRGFRVRIATIFRMDDPGTGNRVDVAGCELSRFSDRGVTRSLSAIRRP